MLPDAAPRAQSGRGRAAVLSAINPVSNLIFTGVFDRFPTLVFIPAEVNCGWVPDAGRADGPGVRADCATGRICRSGHSPAPISGRTCSSPCSTISSGAARQTRHGPRRHHHLLERLPSLRHTVAAKPEFIARLTEGMARETRTGHPRRQRTPGLLDRLRTPIEPSKTRAESPVSRRNMPLECVCSYVLVMYLVILRLGVALRMLAAGRRQLSFRTTNISVRPCRRMNASERRP